MHKASLCILGFLRIGAAGTHCVSTFFMSQSHPIMIIIIMLVFGTTSFPAVSMTLTPFQHRQVHPNAV